MSTGQARAGIGAAKASLLLPLVEGAAAAASSAAARSRGEARRLRTAIIGAGRRADAAEAVAEAVLERRRDCGLFCGGGEGRAKF